MFLIGAYAKYSWPYVWLRSLNQRRRRFLDVDREWILWSQGAKHTSHSDPFPPLDSRLPARYTLHEELEITKTSIMAHPGRAG